MKNFIDISEKELIEINGGGIAGAAAGYLIGVVAGGIGAIIVYCDKDTRGDSKQNAAALTVFTSCVLACTTIGACSTGII